MLAMLTGASPLYMATETPSHAETIPRLLPHRFPIDVLSVVDGDTIKGRVYIWIGQVQFTSIRLRGIDTPELRGKCPYEKDMAQKARLYLQELIDEHAHLFIEDIEEDIYPNRIIATLTNKTRDNIALELIHAKLARPHGKKDKRRPWCP
ncbi:MAG: thermonuclease family protein [Alphaproteobacteria bacterium GM7ARS4]|nr:thermonuclease family protein [Alphaproteobacteria bacterium GM7ARS4]